ncbi:MAG TPA: AMP-binding protein [Anaerolineae bacterium]
MSSDWQWVKADVAVEERADGSVILRNKVPLDPYPDNLVTWLRQNAERFPDKPFLQERSPTGEWSGVTYAEALAAANRLSNGLMALGIPPDAPIAILSENSVNMGLIQLAAMQIGQPVVPISFAYSVRSQTGSHVKHILDVTQAPVLILSDANLHMPKMGQWDLSHTQLFAFANSEKHEGVRPFAEVYSDDGELAAEGKSRFDAVRPDTLAKIQFTSGSTNLPKGVMVSHGMMASNQVGIAQMWPFLSGDEVVVDWLPWNHTFGGNFVFNMMLVHGGTFYIDNGNPTPAGFENTVQNIIDVSPTVYFGVPRSYTALYSRMKTDDRLRQAFFRNLKFIFTAAAALDQATYEGMKAMSREARGEAIPFFSAWGSTETAPDATLVFWEIDDARVIGLPIPGVSIKLAPDKSGKRELRVKGPNVTSGYYNDEIATEIAFDDEGYYHTGDAGKFLDPHDPNAGLIFDGRIGEDFKLSSGVWVHNAALRINVNRLGQPYLLDLVIAAPNRDYLAALVYPNVPVLRARFTEESAAHWDDNSFLQTEAVSALFRDVFQKHNAMESGSSKRFERFALLNVPPRIDKNETTDKGYINQSAVLASHADLVDKLYAEPPPSGIVVI